MSPLDADATTSSGSTATPEMGWAGRRARLLQLFRQELAAADAAQNEEDVLGKLIDRWLSREGKRREEDVDALDALRISARDFETVAHVAGGQFGRVDLVRCKLDRRLYCMKTMDKVVLRRSRQHTNPVREREVHALATTADFELRDTPIPPLLCAFPSPSALHLVTSFHPGGTLWDVLSMHPSARLPEPEVRHWARGMASAIKWLHAQGWAHRDVKPHNFLVYAPGAGSITPPRAILTDFGTAAEEIRKGSGRLRREDCLWPIGTPDYIAPEVLEAHEDALVRAEEEEELQQGEDLAKGRRRDDGPPADGYGLEVDWWSFGVVLFELVYGEAPFFAEKIGDTYTRIVNFETTLAFPDSVPSSDLFRDFIRGLLSHASIRLGKRDGGDVLSHPWLGTQKDDLSGEELFLPPPAQLYPPSSMDSHVSHNSAFAFSDLFVSSPSISLLNSHQSPFRPQHSSTLRSPHSSSFRQTSSARAKSVASWKGNGVELFAGSTLDPAARRADAEDDVEWEGFTWGPIPHAFSPVTSIGLLPNSSLLQVGIGSPAAQTPLRPNASSARNSFQTPLRSTPFRSCQSSTVRRSRPISEQRALQELVDCVGLSARRRVLESGRKPRLLVLKAFDIERGLSAPPVLGGGGLTRERSTSRTGEVHNPGAEARSSTATTTDENRPASPTSPTGHRTRLRTVLAELDQLDRRLDGVRQRVLSWE